MTTPKLVPLPDSFKKMTYQLSGICPRKTIYRMIIAGLFRAVIVGSLGYFGGRIIAWLWSQITLGIAKFLASIGGIFGSGFLWLTVILSFAFTILYPVILGTYIGKAINNEAVNGKCRNEKYPMQIGYLCGAVGYLVFLLIAKSLEGNLPQLTSDFFEPSGSAGFGSYFLMFLDIFLFIIGASWLSANTSITRDPFCEKCGEFYRPSTRGILDYSNVPLLYNAIDVGLAEELQKLDYKFPETFPKISLIVKTCPKDDNNCDVNLIGTAYWNEAVTSREGKQSNRERHKQLFSIMTSRSLGLIVANKLKTQVRPTYLS